MVSLLSVKLVLPSNYSEAIYLKHRGDPNYILPLHTDTITYEHLLLVLLTWFIQMRGW